MTMEIIKWDIYEIKTKSTATNGVMLRGRIRKFCLESNRNVLAENTSDIENTVRFAIPSGEDSSAITEYLNQILPDVSVDLVKENVPNPVLCDIHFLSLLRLKVRIEIREQNKIFDFLRRGIRKVFIFYKLLL